ncbi:MAG: four helix bundle protein [Microgenomates group bacterium]
MKRTSIRSFKDLDVYKNLYRAMIVVLKHVVPKLPETEKYDLASQMNRACKSPLGLLAEGYAKKNYKRSWSKYIDDAIGECNEIISHLSITRDVYSKFVDPKICDKLIEIYDIAGKQLYRLGENWKVFPKKQR